MGPARHDWSARTARPPAASDPPGSRARGRDPGGGTTEGWQRPLAGVPARLALPAEHRPFPLVEVRTRAGPPWSHERAAERGRWAPRRFMVTISDKVKFPNFLMLQLRGCFPSCRTVFQLGRRGAPRAGAAPGFKTRLYPGRPPVPEIPPREDTPQAIPLPGRASRGPEDFCGSPTRTLRTLVGRRGSPC